MPNWCYSVWTFSGEKTDLDKIAETGLDFEKIIPMPDAIRQTTYLNPPEIKKLKLKAKCGYEDWYEWCKDKWGTKWSASSIGGPPDKPSLDRESDKRLVIKMATAWCLPTGIIKQLMHDYPAVNLHIDCMEDCLNFAGSCEVLDGELSEAFYVPSEEDLSKWFESNM